MLNPENPGGNAGEWLPTIHLSKIRQKAQAFGLGFLFVIWKRYRNILSLRAWKLLVTHFELIMSDEKPPHFPKLNYESLADPSPGPRRVFALEWVIVGMFLFLLISAILLSLLNPRHRGEVSYRVKSQSNLRQIGQACLLYTNDYSGQYPDSFETMILTEDIGGEVFISPYTSSTPANGPTTRDIAAQLSTGGHLDYVYLGKGLTSQTARPNTIVAYEAKPDGNGGTNVLFGDGTVLWVPNSFFVALTAKASAGNFPVTMPSPP